jgi:hypothetical protein
MYYHLILNSRPYSILHRYAYVTMIAFAILILYPYSTYAAGPIIDNLWRVTTADFKERTATLTELNNQGVTVLSQSLQQQTFPLGNVVQVVRVVEKSEAISGLVLMMNGGDRLPGRPVRVDGASLIWRVNIAEGMSGQKSGQKTSEKTGANAADSLYKTTADIAVSLEQVLGIVHDRLSDARLNIVRAEDIISLNTGDTVSGIITAASDQSLTISAPAGEQNVPLESVNGLFTASPPGGRPPPAARRFLVRLTSGAQLSSNNITLADGGILQIALPSRTSDANADASTSDISIEKQSDDPLLNVALSRVISIEHLGGPAAWLSMRTPVMNEQTPYFSAAFATQFDRTVNHQPIRVGQHTIARGIGVHSRSRLVFEIQPQDKKFVTRYGMDANLLLADVDVRVRVDDKIIHEKKSVRGGFLSELIIADVTGAKTLTLEVDYGRGFDVQDQLTWIEPAMIQ